MEGKQQYELEKLSNLAGWQSAILIRYANDVRLASSKGTTRGRILPKLSRGEGPKIDYNFTAGLLSYTGLPDLMISHNTTFIW